VPGHRLQLFVLSLTLHFRTKRGSALHTADVGRYVELKRGERTMNKLLGVAALSTVLLGGCSYAVKPVSMPAVNIYSSYDEKIPGTWFIVLDEDMRNIDREISASSHVCSAHKYPINVGDAIATSVNRTMRSVFENTLERKSMPTNQELTEAGAKGTVLVKLDTFEPRVRCSMGFWSGSCTGSADIEFGVIVRGKDGKLFATSVGDSATVDGDSGGACEGVANILSESISKSVKEALERMGERLSNSPKLRDKST